MRVSKVDVALNQVGAAVRLWEDGRDEIAAHTLTCAGLEVIRGVLQARGASLLLDESVRNHIRPESVGDVQRTMRRAQNFFKHADRDANDEHDFDPATTEWLLFMAALGLRQLEVQLPVAVAAFYVYMSAMHHEILVLGPEQRQMVESLRDSVRSQDRGETLSMLRRLISDSGWRG
jgi:hypothetical protein